MSGSAIRFESSLLHVERSSNEADKFEDREPDSVGPQRKEITVDSIGSPPRDFSKPSTPKLSYSFRDRRFYLSLSGDWPTGFRENRDRLRAGPALRRKQIAQVLSCFVSERTSVQRSRHQSRSRRFRKSMFATGSDNYRAILRARRNRAQRSG